MESHRSDATNQINSSLIHCLLLSSFLVHLIVLALHAPHSVVVILFAFPECRTRTIDRAQRGNVQVPSLPRPTRKSQGMGR
jgi:hypothetical protein